MHCGYQTSVRSGSLPLMTFRPWGNHTHTQAARMRDGEMEGAWLWGQVDLVSFPALTLLAVSVK